LVGCPAYQKKPLETTLGLSFDIVYFVCRRGLMIYSATSNSVDPTFVAIFSSLTALPTPTPSPVPVPISTPTFQQDFTTAIRITYDDLFRNNEEHIGKRIAFRGHIDQIQERSRRSYLIRAAVTEEFFGYWDDVGFSFI